MKDDTTTTALAVVTAQPNTHMAKHAILDEEVFRLGQALHESGYYSKDVKSAPQAVAKILAGRELGFGATASLSGIYIVEGKPSMGASLIGAAIKRSGRYDYRVTEHSDTVCDIEFIQLFGGKWVSCGPSSRFTIENARIAKLAGKDVWAKYPRNMLFARAITNGARWYCPDVFLGGIYTPDELSDEFEMQADGSFVPTSQRTVDTTPADVLADRLTESAATARELAANVTPQKATKSDGSKAAKFRDALETDPTGTADIDLIEKAEQVTLAEAARDNGWSKDETLFYLNHAYGYASTRDVERKNLPKIITALGIESMLDETRNRMKPRAATNGTDEMFSDQTTVETEAFND